MSAMVEKNGVCVLLPYAMPSSMDGDGECRDQGRFVVAYSRDGWFVLDTGRDVVLAWAPDEARACMYQADAVAGNLS